MAIFRDTTGISYRLSEIIKNARKRIVIISPFLKFNNRIKELLEDADSRGIEILVIHGKKELKPEEYEWLESLAFVKTGFLQNLHAKCYMNENEALLASMNLYEFSQVNNYEMGVSVSLRRDRVLYEAIRKESVRLVRVSKPLDGYCIRCKIRLPSNLAEPYCEKHFKTWQKFKNGEYPEKYCHACGKKHVTTMNEPLCPECSANDKDELKLAASRS